MATGQWGKNPNDNPFTDNSSGYRPPGVQPTATTPPWLLDSSPTPPSATNTHAYNKVSALDDDEIDSISFNQAVSNNIRNINQKTGYHPSNPPPSSSTSLGNSSSHSNLANQGGNYGTTPAEIDPAIPRMIMYTRIINLALSICMILISSLAILTTQSATTGVLACYVVAFSCLFCCFETHLKQVSKFIALNFGFMYSAKSRAAFMIFVGTIMFSFSLFGQILGLCMLANAGFNIYILFKYPQFDDIQRDNATSEIKDFLKNNPAFTTTVVQGGTDFLKSNPEIAKQGFAAMFSSALGGSSSTPNNTNGAPPAGGSGNSAYVSV